MLRHPCRSWIAFAALAVAPLALMAVSPPAETPAPAQTLDPAVETPAPDQAAVETPAAGQPADLAALADSLFLPEAREVSNHCCPAAAQQACADACRPDPSFTACAGNTCFCVCITIN